ncbi:MAG: calcium/proton exchanger [Pseudanabaenaceae cyanobacterium]
MPKLTFKTVFAWGFLGFVPLSAIAVQGQWGPLAVFGLSALSILPLASWLSTATEELAVVWGPNIGGLLNATFGNATELIVAVVALRAGLTGVVKASLTGSIVGNLLLVLGLSVLLGGLKYKEQTFEPTVARLNASTMNLAVAALALPSLLGFLSPQIVSTGASERIAVGTAIVALVVYALTLVFSMKTHSHLYEAAMEIEAESDHKPSVGLWLGVLAIATVAIAYESEWLVGSFEVAAGQLGLTPLFAGLIAIPIIGNAAEHATAVTVAIKNKMELAVAIAVGSSLQIALFVAPVLVLLGAVLGQPMDLNFSAPEVAVVAIAVLLANSIASDGRSNWLEGALLLGTYSIIGVSFYFYPAAAI